MEFAIKFAEQKHQGQFRKWENVEYVVHPYRVALMVKKFKGDSKHLKELEIAAILHDTLEDTETSFEEIKELFGEMVAEIVMELTTPEEVIEIYGKKDTLATKMLVMSSYALVLKLLDRLDNVSYLDRTPSNFREKYTKETHYILRIIEQYRDLTSTHKIIIEEIKNKIN